MCTQQHRQNQDLLLCVCINRFPSIHDSVCPIVSDGCVCFWESGGANHHPVTPNTTTATVTKAAPTKTTTTAGCQIKAASFLGEEKGPGISPPIFAAWWQCPPKAPQHTLRCFPRNETFPLTVQLGPPQHFLARDPAKEKKESFSFPALPSPPSLSLASKSQSLQP